MDNAIRRPIHDALEALWEELFAADRYDMREVLLTDRTQQKALHMEMAGEFGIDQHYHFDHEKGKWTWRGMPILTHHEDSRCTAYRTHGAADGSTVAITWEHTPEFVHAGIKDQSHG